MKDGRKKDRRVTSPLVTVFAIEEGNDVTTVVSHRLDSLDDNRTDHDEKRILRVESERTYAKIVFPVPAKQVRS